MATATINVRYKNPRQDRRPPSVKTPDNVIYSMSDQLAATIEQGKTYQIEYHTTKSSDGSREFKILDKATEVGNGGSSPAGSGKGAYGSVDEKTAERIFVCGALNALLSNPGWNPNVIDPNGYVAAVVALRQTWERTFGGKPTIADEMGGDEIPYA